MRKNIARILSTICITVMVTTPILAEDMTETITDNAAEAVTEATVSDVKVFESNDGGKSEVNATEDETASVKANAMAEALVSSKFDASAFGDGTKGWLANELTKNFSGFDTSLFKTVKMDTGAAELNVDYLILAKSIGDDGYGETYTLDLKNTVNYSTDAMELFKENFGETVSLDEVEDISKYIDKDKITSDITAKRDRVFAEVKNSTLYQSVKKNLSVGDVFEQAKKDNTATLPDVSELTKLLSSYTADAKAAASAIKEVNESGLSKFIKNGRVMQSKQKTTATGNMESLFDTAKFYIEQQNDKMNSSKDSINEIKTSFTDAVQNCLKENYDSDEVKDAANRNKVLEAAREHYADESLGLSWYEQEVAIQEYMDTVYDDTILKANKQTTEEILNKHPELSGWADALKSKENSPKYFGVDDETAKNNK